jgi:protein-S-isoprenylcysteine O-methyltransferase Ste14
VAQDPAAADAGTGARLFAFAGGALFLAALIYGVYCYAFVFGATAGTAYTVAGPVTIDVALFSIFAAHHSLFARSGLKARVSGLVSSRLERSVYVWLASALFIIVCAAWRAVPGDLWTVNRLWSYPLIAMQLSGIVVTYVASRRLDVLSLAGIRQASGGATTAPVGLLDTGLYGLVRHPIYFGWVLMVWPTPHMTGTRMVFAAVSTLYLVAAIPFEERSLRREFGRDYDSYTTRVRWKMIPGVY